MSRYVELSHVIRDGMAVYPGLPRPRIEPIVTHETSRERYQGKAEFAIHSFALAGNTGTYMDAPYHRFAGRPDLAALPLDAVAGLPGVVVDATATRGRSLDAPATLPGVAGAAVLVRTGWSERWGDESYWEPGPFLSEAFVQALIAGGAALVGVDFWNVDDPADPARPAHTMLLDAGVLIVEHLTNLAALPGDGFRFTAVPLAIEGGASFPVRAYAELA